ncbi:MAG: hypothetical protein LBR57_04205 [Alistipes sp.]|jgi:hypothetical protein|nr:hypothetical protein [Alistipes sp.]
MKNKLFAAGVSTIAILALCLTSCRGGGPVGFATEYLKAFYASDDDKLKTMVELDEASLSLMNKAEEMIEEVFDDRLTGLHDDWGEVGDDTHVFREGYTEYFMFHDVKYDEAASTVGETEATVVFDVTSPNYPGWTEKATVSVKKSSDGKRWVVDPYSGKMKIPIERDDREEMVDLDIYDGFVEEGSDSLTAETAPMRAEAQKFMDALLKFDFDKCNKLMMAPEYTPPGKMKGKEKELYESMKALYADVTAEVDGVYWDDDAAVVSFSFSHDNWAGSSVQLAKLKGKWVVLDAN